MTISISYFHTYYTIEYHGHRYLRKETLTGIVCSLS